MALKSTNTLDFLLGSSPTWQTLLPTNSVLLDSRMSKTLPQLKDQRKDRKKPNWATLSVALCNGAPCSGSATKLTSSCWKAMISKVADGIRFVSHRVDLMLEVLRLLGVVVPLRVIESCSPTRNNRHQHVPVRCNPVRIFPIPLVELIKCFRRGDVEGRCRFCCCRWWCTRSWMSNTVLGQVQY